jgi:hypothetical protein
MKMNTQAQCTKGPWTVGDPNYAGCATYGIHAIDGGEEYVIADVCSDVPMRINQRANARLIAAAPELLALALRVSSLNPDAGEIGDGTLHQLVDAARAALAKATQA